METTKQRKKIFTTGEVAEATGFSQPTVIRWINDGKLDAFFAPGGNHRRVSRAALEKFLQENDMPALED